MLLAGFFKVFVSFLIILGSLWDIGGPWGLIFSGFSAIFVFFFLYVFSARCHNTFLLVFVTMFRDLWVTGSCVYGAVFATLESSRRRSDTLEFDDPSNGF